MSVIGWHLWRWVLVYTFLTSMLAVDVVLAVEPMQAASIPNIDFEIATKRVDRSAVGNGIYVFRMHCGLGSCKLEQLRLNECENTSSGLAFTPKLYTWATWAGNLEIDLVGTNILEVKVYQGTNKMLPAHLKLTFNPEQPIAKQVTAFESTGFLDFSSREGQQGPTLVQLTVLKDPVQTIKMDCPALLFGLRKE